MSTASEIMDSYRKLHNKWNALIDRINDLGGEEFLNNAVMPSEQKIELSREDLTDLIMLCHPDRHKGSVRATRVTKKIILLRKKQY